MSDTPPCLWNGLHESRVIKGRHGPDCTEEDRCPGCLPCPELHCRVCRRVHSDGTCPECITGTRDTLLRIATMCGALPAEAKAKGVNSEAAMLWGPTADPEAWRNRATAAMFGRLDDAYLEDCRDEAHPLWVLGTWEQTWRDHLDQPTDLGVTLSRLVDYLGRQMHVMAADDEVPFEDFVGDLRRCCSHLEAVLHDQQGDDKGAPCPACIDAGSDNPTRLVLRHEDRDTSGASDRWVCPSCKGWWTDAEYRLRVGTDYLGISDRLTASQMRQQYRVTEGTVRQWAKRGHVAKLGRDDAGRMLYSVSDVVSMRDSGGIVYAVTEAGD